MKKYGEMYVGHWMGKEGRETCYYVVIFKKKQRQHKMSHASFDIHLQGKTLQL